MSTFPSLRLLYILASPATARLLQEGIAAIPWWFWVVMAAALIGVLWLLFNQPKEIEPIQPERKTSSLSEQVDEKTSVTPFDLEPDETDSDPVAAETQQTDDDETSRPFVEEFPENPTEAPSFEPYLPDFDDLTVIEGIGPKIHMLLKQADIHTFAALAEKNPEELHVILAGGGIFLTDPSSWPEQSSLAAEGRWEELRILQKNLKGGRNIS